MEREERSNAKKSSRRPATGRSPAQAASQAVQESPDPARIRVLAYEIYETRNANGMLGDPVSDWLEAERRLAEAETTAPRAAETAGGGSPETRSSRTRARRQPAGK